MSTDSHNPPDAELSSTLITPEGLAVWKSEIRAFFAATEQKLRKFREAGDSHADSRELPGPIPSSEKTRATAFGNPTTVHEIAAEGVSVDRLQAIKNRLAAQLENVNR